MRISRWIGIAVLLGLIGGLSVYPRKKGLEKPVQEIQITGDERFPLSIAELTKAGNGFLSNIEYTDITGVPSDPYCAYWNDSEVDRYTATFEYDGKRVRHSLTGGFKFSDGIKPGDGSREKSELAFRLLTPNYGNPREITVLDRKTGESYSALESQ